MTRKAFVPRYDPSRFWFAVRIGRVMDVPLHLLGILLRRDGRSRSAYRHRNRGRV